MRFAPPGGEAREGAKMPFGLDQLVAERAAQYDVAGCTSLSTAASAPGLRDLRQEADVHLA